MKGMTLVSVASHRNGPGFGEPFYAVAFRYRDDKRTRRMIAIVYVDPGASVDEVHPCNGHVAVLDAELAASGIVEFGVNSWDADQFEPQLRQWIAQFEAARVPRPDRVSGALATA